MPGTAKTKKPRAKKDPAAPAGTGSAAKAAPKKAVRKKAAPKPVFRTGYVALVGRPNSGKSTLSTGMIRAPDRAASRVMTGPPTTMDSLLARATRRPARTAARVGPKPSMPVMAERTISAASARATSTAPSGPWTTRIRQRRPRPRSFSASRFAPTETRAGRYFSIWAARSAALEPAARATTRRRPSSRSTTSSALRPMEPVEPRMARPRGVCPKAYFQR